MASWDERARTAIERYREGEDRVGGIGDVDERQRQLTRLGNVAWAAGLCLLMRREPEAADWLRRAAQRYRESWDAGAPPDAWGRPIAATKSLLLAGDDAAGAARWALDAGAAQAASPIGRYAATLALLVLGEDADAAEVAASLRQRDDFPHDVAESLAALAVGDREGYAAALENVLRSFETREAFLEDVPVADTCLVLERLAEPRGLASGLRASERLPSCGLS